MLNLCKRLFLGVVLIAVAAGSLLLSDLDRRKKPSARGAPVAKPMPRLAVMQWNSTDLMDNTVKGLVEGLRRNGFENGRSAQIRFFNASGDTVTGNAMARDLASGSYDMVLTVSTLGLQAVAKANVRGATIHVFGGVTDPYGAGVGITGPGSEQHPPHLVGVGTFQPVERAIRVARQINPRLSRLGVVWNPSESNSEACVAKARQACKEMEIGLIEANAGHTSEVPEAVRAVLARGVEAIWVGGDLVAISSMAAIVSAARAGKVPVFTNDPSDVKHGALFGLGASYQQVGLAVGEIGGRILKGESTKRFGVANLVPEVLELNEPLGAELGQPWVISPEVRALGGTAAATDAGGAPSKQGPGAPWRIFIVRYNDAQFSEETHRGILDGFERQGLRAGRDLQIRYMNAQGDMATLTTILTAVKAETPDLVMPVATPSLQASLRQLGKEQRIVFACVADGVQAGAGRTIEDHLPNVTGITTRSPFEGMARLIKASVPGVRAVGTLFSPAEINSEIYRRWFAEALGKEGIELVAVPVNSGPETAEASTALVRKPIQLVCQISDNTVRPAFAQVIRRARDAGLPFLCFDDAGIKEGGTVSLGRDFYSSGVEAAEMAVHVLRGASPREIPFTNTRTELFVINPELVNLYKMAIPPDWLKRAKAERSRER